MSIINIQNKRASSTIEYIVITTAVVSVFIVFMGDSGIFTRSLNRTLASTTNELINMSYRLSVSRPSEGLGGTSQNPIIPPANSLP